MKYEDVDLYPAAVEHVRSTGKVSTGRIQRILGIGYNRAAALVEAMEAAGVVSRANHLGRREVLAEPTISISVGDVNTGPVTMGQVKEALDQVRGGAKMKDDPDWNGHNSQAYAVAADELRQFIEQFEQLEAEKKDIADRQKEVMSEAKARGYDTKIMKKVIALRKRDRDDVAEEEAILEMYKTALDMV